MPEAKTIDLTQLSGGDLVMRFNSHKTRAYTEKDDGDWYIVTANHSDRLGEDFCSRDDARRFVCALAGDPLPKDWRLTPCGTALVPYAYDLDIGGKYRATVWTRSCSVFVGWKAMIAGG